MLPLALILQNMGGKISGSDRAHDQGQSEDKFKKLKELGIELYPQDGSGVTQSVNRLIVSGAIEDTIPDVAAAKTLHIPIKTRAEVLAALFNSYQTALSIAGTSGKSTTTGMTASIFVHAGKDPTVMNGAIIENFRGAPASPFPNMRTGQSDVFITETDESDGSIALYNPAIAVLNNIALDHMSIDELKDIFLKFCNRATQGTVLNIDDNHIRTLLPQIKTRTYTYSLHRDADLRATHIKNRQDGVSFEFSGLSVNLNVPGEHNVSNALAALSASIACGIDLQTAITGLETFTGIARRMQTIGMKNDITIIDDFAHNPDKIAASLKTLREFDGRLIIMFQPHGFGPLRLMGKEIIDSFTKYLTAKDYLIMPEAYYAGGTVDRSVTAKDIIASAKEKGLNAYWFENRAGVKSHIIQNAQKGDRIVIMGARDDTLTDFAKDILAAI